jgi:hypothetical protein
VACRDAIDRRSGSVVLGRRWLEDGLVGESPDSREAFLPLFGVDLLFSVKDLPEGFGEEPICLTLKMEYSQVTVGGGRPGHYLFYLMQVRYCSVD